VASRRFTIFALFAFPYRSPKSALANFDPNPNTNSITRVNSTSYDNSNAYAATPIPDLTDTLEGDLIIRLHVHASSWFKPPTDGSKGCLVKMDFVGQK
jgi:hypothetical protein